MVYSRVQNCKVYGSRVTMMQQASREVWYLQEKAEEDGWLSYFALTDSEPILSLVKDVEQLDTEHLSRSQLGIIKLDVAMKRLFVPAATEDDESATYNVIVYKGQGKDAKILYQTVKNDGNEILKKYWEETANQKDGANSNGRISTYTVDGQTLEEYGLNLLFLFDNQDSWQKRVEIIEAILPLLLLLIVTVTGLIYWYSKDFSSRVELLVRKFRRAETGDLSVSEEISGSDEIAVLDQQFNRMLGKLDQLIKTRYVQKLENKEAQLKNLQLHINKESFEHQRFRPVDHELVSFTIRNIFEEIDAQCDKLLVNSLSDANQLYGIFAFNDKKKLRMEVERIFLRMRSVLEKKMGIYLTIGVSRCCSRVQGRDASEASQALKQRIIYGKANIYFYEDVRILGEQEFPVSQLHLLEQYMEHNEVFKIKNLVQEIFSEELVKKYGSAYLRIMWIRILNSLLHHYDRRGRNAAEIEKLLQSYNLPDQIQSIQEIGQKIVEMVMVCVSTESVTDANARSKIQMAVGYIQEHFGENLTVNDLAEHYGMSPNYFSSMFKKEMSRSAVNYITELRINQARELLYHSELFVSDDGDDSGGSSDEKSGRIYQYGIFLRLRDRTVL